MLQMIRDEFPEFREEIQKTKVVSEETSKKLTEVIQNFSRRYLEEA